MPEAVRRLFFALWPDPVVRAGIIERRQLVAAGGCRPVPEPNLHLTLVFLGDQPVRRLAALTAAAGQIQGRAGRLVLDRFGWFPRAGVIWLGGEAGAALAEFQLRLERAMSALGIELDDRPFRPHVTLFRKARRRPRLPAAPSLSWPFADFVLVQSRPGRPYRVIGRWPLGS